jgi:tetratricopeptide (TPR) repeat protein
MFDQFEHSKMTENVEKFYGVDKYKKEIKSISAELEEKKGDAVLLAKLELNQEKLAKATETAEKIQPIIEQYDELGPEKIAKMVKDSGWLTTPAISKIKDAARNANDFLVLEAKAPENDSAKREYDKAILYHEKSLAIKLKVHGAHHTSTSLSYNNLGSVCFKKGDLEKAIVYYEKSLEIDLKVYGNFHRSTAITYTKLGDVYIEKKELILAKECYNKAYAIYNETLGQDDAQTKLLIQKLNDL